MLTYYRLTKMFLYRTTFNKAQLRIKEDWNNAAEFISHKLDDLKSTTSGDAAPPANFGLNPQFRPAGF
jgi:hypothetical protein